MRTILFLLSAFLIVSCGNTVEHQLAAWESNKAEVQQYAAKYTYLADSINAQYTIAKENMEAANQIVDEKNRIKAMKQANSICTEGPIETIKKFEKAIESLKNETNYLRENIKSNEFSPKTGFLLEEARNYLDKANAVISKNYTSADSALTIFENESMKLAAIILGLEKHYSEIEDNRPKETEKIAGNSEVKDSTSIQSGSATNESITLRCKKCGSTLKKDDDKCKNCGAPVKN